MDKLFSCYACNDNAFLTTDDIAHHGEPDAIDHDADADHSALDPDQIEVKPALISTTDTE